MPWTFEQSRAGYRNLWLSASIKDGMDSQNAETFASKILEAEQRYRAVESQTGVPWFFIGALHMREASCNFGGILHNGQKIIGTGQKSTIVPIGVGPFATWEESALDVLRRQKLSHVTDWSVEHMLYRAEAFNGWGYSGRVNSPYVWAGTTKEESGKFIADHVWDPNADDKQIGVACVLKRLAEKRSDIAAALATEAPRDGEILPPISTLPAVPSAQQIDLGQIVAAFLPLLQHIIVNPDARKLILPIVAQTFGLKPASEPEPVPVPTPSPAPVPSGASVARPSVWLSIASLVGAAFGMDQGIIGTPLGMGQAPTTTGTLSILAPLATAAIGATGGFAPIAKIGMSLVSAFAQSIVNRKSS